MKLLRARQAVLGVFTAALLITVASCSGDPKERTASDAISSLVASNKNVAVFGHVSVLSILKKANYKSIPKVNMIIDAQVNSWKSAFNLDGPTYFAIEGPFSHDANPAAVYAIMDISAADSVVSKIHELGFATEKSGKITYFQDGDVTCGVRNKLFILVSKSGDYDGKKAITDAFKATESDLSEDTPHEIITKESDVVVGVSLERIYNQANTELNKIPADKKKELQELLADGYIETSMNFEKGEFLIESKNLFSDDLKARLWFKDEENTNLVKKLGKGKPWMGIAGNIDMDKLNAFTKDFALSGASELTKSMSPGLSGMMMFTGLNITNAVSGEFGMVATGNPRQLGSELEFNAFVGINPKDKSINMLVQSLFAGSPKKNGAYILDNMAIKPKADGIYAYGIKNKAKGALVLPPCASNFGKNTFSAFINFGAMDIKSLELEKEMQFLELIECVSVESNSDGTTVRVSAKNKTKNILDQITNYYYKSYKNELYMMM